MAARPPLRVLLTAEPGPQDRVLREAATVRDTLSQLEAEGAVSVLEAGSAFGGASLSVSSFEALLARTFDVLHVVADAERNGAPGGEAAASLGR